MFQNDVAHVRYNYCSVTDLNIRILAVYAVFTQMVVVISAQNCSDTVGFLDRDGNLTIQDQTYLLTDQQYTVPCKGKVTAWEFCYQAQGPNTTSVSFYAGIWNTVNHSGNITYVQANSNVIAFVPNGTKYSCQIFNVSVEDQFIAQAGSIVGLYSNTGIMSPQLLYTNSNDTTTYRFGGNPKNVAISDDDEMFDYRIAIKLHLG